MRGPVELEGYGARIGTRLGCAALVVLERIVGLCGRGRGLVFRGDSWRWSAWRWFDRLLNDLKIDYGPCALRRSFRVLVGRRR